MIIQYKRWIVNDDKLANINECGIWGTFMFCFIHFHSVFFVVIIKTFSNYRSNEQQTKQNIPTNARHKQNAKIWFFFLSHEMTNEWIDQTYMSRAASRCCTSLFRSRTLNMYCRSWSVMRSKTCCDCCIKSEPLRCCASAVVGSVEYPVAAFIRWMVDACVGVGGKRALRPLPIFLQITKNHISFILIHAKRRKKFHR